MQKDNLADFQKIDEQKFVLKAAQAVWAANKYFVLACGQEYYLRIRYLLRPDVRELEAAYDVLTEVATKFKTIKSEELPQLINALFHIAGYFKEKLSTEERQQLNHLIQTNPHLALDRLEDYTFAFNIDYLCVSTIWQKHRMYAFDEVPVGLKHKGITYEERQLAWKGNHVLVKRKMA